jgi:hypothetical protein
MLTRSPSKTSQAKPPHIGRRRNVRMLGEPPLVEIMPTRVYLMLERMLARERVKAMQSRSRMQGKRERDKTRKGVPHQRRHIDFPVAIIDRIKREARPVGKDRNTVPVDDKTFEEMIDGLIAKFVIEKVTGKK